MIYIITHTQSARLDYCFRLIFGQLLGVEWACISQSEYKPELHPTSINYTASPITGTFLIPNAGLLESNSISTVDWQLTHGDIPYLFSFPPTNPARQLDYDIFSASFYLVSEYEKYLALDTDQHERYHQPQYPTARLGLDTLPLVHLYVAELKSAMTNFFGEEITTVWSPPHFDYEITWDIDAPWKYLKKGFKIVWGGLIKAIIKGDSTSTKERLRAIFTQKDPYHTFNQIFRLCPPDHTRFFFLIDRNSPHDTRFTWEHPAFRSLMQEIHRKGYGTGLHPSFTSFLDQSRIKTEHQALSAVLNYKITHARQHFLKYRLPTTYRYLLEMGVRHEYTQCLFHTGGFPNGMACPYPWFDLMRNTETKLMLHPTIIMDRTLQQYLNLQPAQAESRWQDLLEKTREVNGIFTLLLHNDVLSESEEWRGWSKMVEEMLGRLTVEG